MKFRFLYLVIVSVILSCNNDSSKPAESEGTEESMLQYDAAKQMDQQKSEEFMYSIARYVAPRPSKASEKSKFDTTFDQPYRTKVSALKLDAYFVGSDGYHYFMISRLAPSIKEKRVATGGRLKYSADGAGIAYYEEVYRTWKMEEPEFKKKAFFLFDKMVKGADLSPYYTASTGDNDRYIEFPDAQTRYDIEGRKWDVIGATIDSATIIR